MGARQSSPGIGGGCGGSSSLTATATATGPSSSGAGTSTNSSPRVQGTSNENNGATPSSSTSGVAGFGGLVSSSLCQNGSTRTRPIASNSTGNGGPGSSGGGPSDWRQRARSLTNVINSSGHHHHPHNITTANGQPFVTVSPLGYSSFGFSASPDSFTSIDDLATFGQVFSAHSLPLQLVPFNGIKCPVCSKAVLPDDVECHLVMCLTKPRISYNEDILTEDKGECVICLDDLSQGDTIARLPCLCIYHKSCIDAWFEVNRSCPEHPSD